MARLHNFVIRAQRLLTLSMVLFTCACELFKCSVHEQKKKLIAGIVLTGGGSQLKHLKQLVEYITGMDTRVGYPSEHLAGDTQESVSSPLFATAVGLLMNALEHNSHTQEEVSKEALLDELNQEEPAQNEVAKKRKSILDRFGEKLKEFLDNA